MRSIYALCKLVDKYATEIEKSNLDGDELEEYGTMLLRLQNQVETGEPIEWIVNECLEWLTRFTARVSPPLQGNAA